VEIILSDDLKTKEAGTLVLSASSSNLPVIEESAAGNEVLSLYADYRDRFGRPNIPGILKCFATHPPLLESMMNIASTLLFVDGHLTRRHKEMIATLISSQNNCRYCADSHGSHLRAQGGSAELLCAMKDGCLDSPSLIPAEQALLRFALKINADSRSITPDDIETTMQAGWTEAQIAEAVHVTALFATFNRVANTFGLPSAQMTV
jgi:uncharacterized peroxidase-related enzyme